MFSLVCREELYYEARAVGGASMTGGRGSEMGVANYEWFIVIWAWLERGWSCLWEELPMGVA